MLTIVIQHCPLQKKNMKIYEIINMMTMGMLNLLLKYCLDSIGVI